MMDVTVKVRREVKGKKVRYFAVVEDEPVGPFPEFLVGTEIAYPPGSDKKGLFLTENKGDTYDRVKYRDNPDPAFRFGFWADFIYPSAQCETRGHFRWLNTYDRAYFTFGLLQYAAHVPGGDFVKLFRALLKTAPGKDYFPDLSFDPKGFIQRRTGDGKLVALETKKTTRPLMEYLNPTRLAVEQKEEVDRAARLIRWCDTHQEHRDLQVKIGIEGIKEKMKTYNKWYKLNGVLDKVCLVIMDIHHQGRGTRKAVRQALTAGGDAEADFNNLLKIGEKAYKERVKTLREKVAELVTDGTFGKRKYDETKNDFVPL